MKGPLADHGIEGPVYADRVGGRLTFRDWQHWSPDDQFAYAQEFLDRAPKRAVFEHMQSLGIVDHRFA